MGRCFMGRSIIIKKNAVSEIKDSRHEKNNRTPKKINKLKKRYKFLIFLICLLALFLGVLKYAELKMQPIVKSMAAEHARNIGSRVISEAINEEIEDGNISYNDLISFEKDNDGSISALKTDIIMINRLKSKLSVVILNKLSDISVMNLYIPVGNLINGEFLSGRGPRLEVRVLPVGSVSTDISNIFTSSGINQTRHQIMLDVRVTLTVIMPFSAESTDIATSICIAETVIIGDVPNTYFN